jgi:hypothetical protein
MKLIPALLSSALVLSLSTPVLAQTPNPATPAAAPAEAAPAPKKEKKAKKAKKSKKAKKEGEAK